MWRAAKASATTQGTRGGSTAHTTPTEESSTQAESGATEEAATSPPEPERGNDGTATKAEGITMPREQACSGPAEELSLTFQAFEGHDEWLVSVPRRKPAWAPSTPRTTRTTRPPAFRPGKV